MVKKYKVIYADPAWSYGSAGKKGLRGAVGNHYQTMSLQEIKDLPIQENCDKDCVLFMWATMPKLKEAFEVIEAWGFEYKTCAFTWIKKNKNDGNLFWGLGHWTRANTELCLLATKGKPKRVSKGVHSVIISKIKKHSEKPHETRVRIDKLMGDVPKIELFARHKFDKWQVWGNQAPKETQKRLA